ncbi:MAG: hypothetical protein LBK95_19835 [Bifidobacteriaceae bacterium]|jgi:hypothetical protein|nr:hypothetical protein [Bifidobacteriaceae bacterium]
MSVDDDCGHIVDPSSGWSLAEWADRRAALLGARRSEARARARRAQMGRRHLRPAEPDTPAVEGRNGAAAAPPAPGLDHGAAHQQQLKTLREELEDSERARIALVTELTEARKALAVRNPIGPPRPPVADDPLAEPEAVTDRPRPDNRSHPCSESSRVRGGRSRAVAVAIGAMVFMAALVGAAWWAGFGPFAADNAGSGTPAVDPNGTASPITPPPPGPSPTLDPTPRPITTLPSTLEPTATPPQSDPAPTQTSPDPSSTSHRPVGAQPVPPPSQVDPPGTTAGATGGVSAINPGTVTARNGQVTVTATVTTTGPCATTVTATLKGATVVMSGPTAVAEAGAYEYAASFTDVPAGPVVLIVTANGLAASASLTVP